MIWCRDVELKSGLQIRLLKNCENSSGIRNLKLTVKICLPINGVNKTMKPLTRVCVGECSFNN